MRAIAKSTVTKIACLAIFLTLAGSARAQCGGTFESLMNTIAATKAPKAAFLPAKSVASFPTPSNNAVNTSIVGLWRIKFIIQGADGPGIFQEAFQIWNAGGTEVHNPKVDPRGGSVCLGSWVQDPSQVFQLTHRVWLYDGAGSFQVLAHLTETLTLGDRGATHSGTFTLQAVDDNDNPLGPPLTGKVVGVRITPN